MAEENKAGGEASAGKSSAKKPILIGTLVGVLALGGGAGAYLMLGGRSGTEQGAGAEQAKEEPVKASYLSLAPPFVVNFQPGPDGQKPKAKFLSVEMDAMVADPALVEAIKEHMPAIRNGVIMLLSRQTYEELLKPEGKEKLRAAVLEEIRATVKKTAGKEGVMDVYFTSFVMQ